MRTALGLIAEGRLTTAGLRAHEDRRAHPDSGYRIAMRPEKLPLVLEKRLHTNPSAWAFWQARAPGYRHSVVHGVASAKGEPTRARRLQQLIADGAAGRRLGALTSPAGRG